MKIEELVERADCPVCGSKEIFHDPAKHEVSSIKSADGVTVAVWRCECKSCGASGHVEWNDVRKDPWYCCWPDPQPEVAQKEPAGSEAVCTCRPGDGCSFCGGKE